MTVIIITDSRGVGLQHGLNSVLGKSAPVTVVVTKGAGYELAAIKVLPLLTRLKPHLVILLLGICDLTFRSARTRVTSLRHLSVSQNVEHVLAAARAAIDILTATNRVKISLATITGIELADYNNPARRHMDAAAYRAYNATKVRHPHQGLLNDSVMEINRRLVQINRANSIPTPWMAGPVHACFKRAVHHYYIRLTDGCHLDEPTKNAWISLLAKYLLKFKINKVMTVPPMNCTPVGQ